MKRHGSGAGTASRFRLGVAGGLLGACLIASGSAAAFQRIEVAEGEWVVISYTLPSLPHEARRLSQGYAGVRYSICIKDGTATGLRFSGFQPIERGREPDYMGLCGTPFALESLGPFTKRLRLYVPTWDDDRREGDESFMIELTNPEVRRPGGDWVRHGGSHHVPSRLSFRVVIRDND